MNVIFGVFLALGIIGLILVYYFEVKDFNRTGANKFKIYTYIPFEVNRFKRDRKDTYAYPILHVLSTIMLVIPILMFAIDVQNKAGNVTVPYTLFTIMTLAYLTYNILTFIKLSNYKLHMIFTTIFVALTLLLEILSIFFFSTDRFMYGSGILSKEVQISTFVVSIILLIFEFILMLNPKYKNWFKMVKVDAETYNRPKFCYLAILEWGTLLNLILSYIPIIVVMFIR